jgi:hypothetical protein
MKMCNDQQTLKCAKWWSDQKQTINNDGDKDGARDGIENWWSELMT